MKDISQRIENIETVFIVSRKKSKSVKCEEIWINDIRVKVLAVFSKRKRAETFINYWNNGKDIYEIFERKLK